MLNSNNNFLQLIQAVKGNDLQALQALISAQPELALESDTQHGSALLIALKTSNNAIVELLIKTLNTLEPSKVTALLKEINHNGCNLLHHIARRDNYTLYEALITLLGKETEILAQHINYHYNLPLDLTSQHLISKTNAEGRKIHDGLLEQTLDKQFVPLTKPITFAEVIKAYHLDKNTPEQLLNNLSASCIAANHVRHMLNASSTHPSCNQLSDQEFNAIIQRIHVLRRKTDAISPFLPNYPDQLEAEEKIIQQDKIANCGEIAELVALNLTRMNLKQNIEVVDLKNGDHVLAVVGRDPRSNIDDVNTWGENAVMVDAWSGRIYPAKEIVTQLKDYQRFESERSCSDKYPGKKFNLTFFYEPKYHKLNRVGCLPSSQELCQDRPKDLSHFEQNEIDEMAADRNAIAALKMSP